MAGLTEIPATVLENAQDDTLLELALVENLQRKDLDPMEKASAFKTMMTGLDLTQADVAERVGMKRATVANHVRLLELPPEAQQAVVAGLITMGHAKALLGLGDADAVRGALAQTVRDELSVRALEKLVKRALSGAADTSQQAPAGPVGGRIPAWVRDLERRMRDRLGTRVSIQNRSGYKGQIVLRYHDRNELDRLCEVLAPKDELA
jgi:ParB family chromosome partitioning protein